MAQHRQRRRRQLVKVELLEQDAGLGPVALGGVGDLGVQVGVSEFAEFVGRR